MHIYAVLRRCLREAGERNGELQGYLEVVGRERNEYAAPG
jgi:hypothetical protein